MFNLKSMKEEIKSVGPKIREMKSKVKSLQKSGQIASTAQSNLAQIRWEVRHLFIAYCVARNKDLAKVESAGSLRPPSQPLIDKILSKFEVNPELTK